MTSGTHGNSRLKNPDEGQLRPGARRWDPRRKREIVEATFVPGASVAQVARRNDVNDNMLFRWRAEYLRGDFGPASPGHKLNVPGPDFLPLGVINDDGQLVLAGTASGEKIAKAPEPRLQQRPPGLTRFAAKTAMPSNRVELEIQGRLRLRFDANIDQEALQRLITLVKELS